MTISRFRVAWSGWSGGPGISTHFTSATWDPTAFLSALRTFYLVYASEAPFSVTLTFPSSYDQIDETTGTLVDSFACTPPAPVTGSNGAVLSS